MKCQILFPGKNKKNISKCRLLKNLSILQSIHAKCGKTLRRHILYYSMVHNIENKLAERDTSLRKQAYSNILKILQPKMEKFQINKPYTFHISAQNIDCGYSLEPPRRGGSNEYHNLYD